MKFTCTHDNLVHALQAVSGVANKQGHLPILQNILFRAKEAGVELIATDLEIVVKTNLRAKVEAPGDFTVPAKTVTEYVTLLTDPQVAVALDGGELLITAGASSTKIKGMSADDFPVIPMVETKDTATVETAMLKNALASVTIAAAKTIFVQSSLVCSSPSGATALTG